MAVGQGAPFDAFDAKAEVLALLDAAGAPVANLQVFPMPDRPGTQAAQRGSASVQRRSSPALGELHPSLKSLEAPAGAVAAEIYLDAIPAPRSSGHARPAYTPPALQAVTRDFAFIVPADLPPTVSFGRSAAPTRLRLLTCGCSIVSKRRMGLSLALEVTLQPGEKSFTDEQIGEISARIVAAAGKARRAPPELVRAR